MCHIWYHCISCVGMCRWYSTVTKKNVCWCLLKDFFAQISVRIPWCILFSSSTICTWRFQPHFSCGAPNWLVIGFHSWFLRHGCQCSSGVPGNITVNITVKGFPCILSVFCLTSTPLLLFMCAYSLIVRYPSPWLYDNFISG